MNRTTEPAPRIVDQDDLDDALEATAACLDWKASRCEEEGRGRAIPDPAAFRRHLDEASRWREAAQAIRQLKRMRP